MARISGVDIPKQKRGVISLTYIYGVGKSLAKKVLTLANVDENKKVNQWNDDEISRIRAEVSKLTIEGELRSETQLNIKRLMDIGSYRGIRHRTGLPLRGQKTKNNSRTRKGKRKTCLLYTSDAADDLLCVDLGGRRIIKKKKSRMQNCKT